MLFCAEIVFLFNLISGWDQIDRLERKEQLASFIISDRPPRRDETKQDKTSIFPVNIWTPSSALCDMCHVFATRRKSSTFRLLLLLLLLLITIAGWLLSNFKAWKIKTRHVSLCRLRLPRRMTAFKWHALAPLTTLTVTDLSSMITHLTYLPTQSLIHLLTYFIRFSNCC